MEKLCWVKDKIINGSAGASTSEQIAAAFVLDNMAYLPRGYTVVEGWERLDNWQVHVKVIQRDCMHLIKAG